MKIGNIRHGFYTRRFIFSRVMLDFSVKNIFPTTILLFAAFYLPGFTRPRRERAYRNTSMYTQSTVSKGFTAIGPHLRDRARQLIQINLYVSRDLQAKPPFVR